MYVCPIPAWNALSCHSIQISPFQTNFPEKKLYLTNLPLPPREKRKLLAMMDMFIILTMVMVSWMYTYAKTFQMAYLQYVPFVSLQLHFNKAVKQKLPSQSLLHCHYLTYFSPKEKLILNQLVYFLISVLISYLIPLEQKFQEGRNLFHLCNCCILSLAHN